MRDDNFERELDAALTRYAAVEPRRGLEERVLANLRAEQGRETTPAWRRWPVAASVGAAVAILCAVAVWHGARTKQVAPAPVAATHSDDARAVAEPTDRHDLKFQVGSVKEGQKRRTKAVAVYSVAEDGPKLDQFPAPQPLTEQEKLLLSFVQDEPAEAALVAQAQTEALQQKADEMNSFGLDKNSREAER